MDEDEDDDMDTGALPDWTNISKPVVTAAETETGHEDDKEWEAAIGSAAAQKELDKQRREREEKMLQEQKLAKEKSLAEATEKNRKLQAERKAKEEEEARKRDQKEQEEKERAKKAKDATMNDVMNTEQTVFIESQQNVMNGIMNEYEQSYYDNDLAGGASPNSDFGF